jgi:hypothetical protein
VSVQYTKAVLRDFLTNKQNDVLALTGAWGVGKTYAWTQALKANKERISFKQYCYVSLFGIKTMSDLRMAIFAKSVPVKTFGDKLTFATINENWAALGLAGGKALASNLRSVLNTIPHGNSVSVGLESLAPHFVRDTLICIDDFERQTDLTVEDILGLISELKEEKSCKVALIFNEAKLGKRDDYRAYKEKVIDYEVLYAPTVNEAFDLVFDASYPNREQVLRCVVDLEITNVRILRKVNRVVGLVVAAAAGLNQSVLEQSITTAILLCWVGYEPGENKPKIEDIEAWNKELISYQKDEDRDAAAQVWVKRLKAYGFTHVDDLDLAIARIVERGYVEGTKYIEVATILDSDLRKKAVSESFTAVWSWFHNSFSDDQDLFIEELYRATLEAINNINSADLSGTVTLLRQLERSDLADELITKFVDAHMDQPGVFNLADHPFGGSINDPKLRATFDAIHARLVQLPSLEESLYFMARTSSYRPEHIEALKRATVDEYHALFLARHSDVKLTHLISWTLRWAETDYAEITVKAREALARIKETSLLNSIRVGRRGI